jgi:hypothetical protein
MSAGRITKGVTTGLGALLILSMAAASVTGCTAATAGLGQVSRTSGVAATGGPVPALAPVAASPAPALPASTPSVSASASQASPPVPPLSTVPLAPLHVLTIDSASGTSRYTATIWAQDDVADCASHAYGAPVIAFLRAHPCTGVTRALATTTVNGRPVAIASAVVSFANTPDTAGPDGEPTDAVVAGEFETLVDQDDTGNITSLLNEGARFPGAPTKVPYPNAFAELGQDGAVFGYEAWYLDGHTADNDPALETLELNLPFQLQL